MAPSTPIAARFSSSRERLKRAPAAWSRASGWPPLSTSTSGATAPDLKMRMRFSSSKDRFTNAAVALICTAALLQRSMERSAARRSIRRSRLSLVACRSNTTADSCSDNSVSINLIRISSSDKSKSAIGDAGRLEAAGFWTCDVGGGGGSLGACSTKASVMEELEEEDWRADADGVESCEKEGA
ncbi:hypothetical protein C4D60_Mb09t13190 [Musa balbisiana]|uniref:Uncharacterized protein n=1 Tax=Musa balbisiana TaxID=52838 RepID=A0A4S8IG21_MUSBA|nr:hypothetical protein C4D60_Mb09t13190 [Musa balbisiana]